MPEITVAIEWDWPDEPYWLNPDNIALALHAYCENTRFNVREVTESEAIKGFVKRVEARAEINMEKTGKLEGAHYAAMKAELAQLDITPEQEEPCAS